MGKRRNPLKQSILTLLMYVGLSTAHAENLADLIYLSEDSPPMNYLEEGVLKGAAVDLLEQATQMVGSPVQRSTVRVLPWARAYREAISSPNRVIFSIYRTPDREHLFKWAGPIDTNRLVLVAKKQRKITITTLQELNRFNVGAQREDAAEIHLRNLELGGMVLTLTVTPLQLAKMLVSDRIDVWAGGVNGIMTHLALANADPADFEVVGTLHQADLYFGFSRNIDDALINEFQQAIDKILSPHNTANLINNPQQLALPLYKSEN
jgi:polar amino acid transport system substrate-binding protein